MSSHKRCSSASELSSRTFGLGPSPIVIGLSLSAYDQRIIDLLLKDDASLLEIVCLSSFVGDTAASVSKGVLTLLRYRNADLVESFLKRIFRTRAIEYVCKSRDLSDIIRDNSMATMLLNAFAKSDGYGFLSISLTAPLNGIFHTLDSCEIDSSKLRYAAASNAIAALPLPSAPALSPSSTARSESVPAPFPHRFSETQDTHADDKLTPPTIEETLLTNRKNLQASCTRLFTHVFENRKRMPPSLRRMCQFILETVNEMAVVSLVDLADRVRTVKRQESISSKNVQSNPIDMLSMSASASQSGSINSKTLGRSSTSGEVYLMRTTDVPVGYASGMSLTGTSVASSDSQEYLPNGQLPSQRKLLRMLSFKKKNRVAESPNSSNKDLPIRSSAIIGPGGSLGHMGIINGNSRGIGKESSWSGYASPIVASNDLLANDTYGAFLESRDDVENAAFQDYGTPVISLSFEKGSSIRNSPLRHLSTTEIHTSATSTEAAQSCFQTGSRSSILQGQTPTSLHQYQRSGTSIQGSIRSGGSITYVGGFHAPRSADMLYSRGRMGDADTFTSVLPTGSISSEPKNNTVDGNISPFSLALPALPNSSGQNATYLGKTRGSERSMSMFSVSPRSAGCLTIAEKVVGSFLFLRFFVPAITSPETNALLLSEKLTTPRRRGLVLCGKLLTALCNDIEFGNKEDYLMVFNDYLKDYREAMKEYISYASSPSPPANLQSLSNADSTGAIVSKTNLVRDNTITKESLATLSKSYHDGSMATELFTEPDTHALQIAPAYLKAEPEKSLQESQIPDHLQMGIPNPLLPYDSPGYMILESPDVDKPVTPTSLTASPTATTASKPTSMLQRKLNNRPKHKPIKQKPEPMYKSNVLSRSMPSLAIDTKPKLMKSILGGQHNDPKTSLDEQAEHSGQTTPTAYHQPTLPSLGAKIPLNISKPYSSSSEAVTSPTMQPGISTLSGVFASPAGSSPLSPVAKMPPAAEIESDLAGLFHCLVKSIDRIEREVDERVQGLADRHFAQTARTNFSDLKSLLEHGPYSDPDRSTGGPGGSKKKNISWWSRIFSGNLKAFK
ncbi:hypothetical protein BASA50_010057 [Batrachochytrium salamandrivorans]|uniref:Ras-GAP domain-containing protein n=1 Tax=Batrachochytrium salamandrivorans TaxID=1357716 RepID=A0ABQ8EZJ9_9FUNG|nr:hypothetical protein BASA62_002614 [Batrachochytrium salamandrivorans]KAH6589403.1 hypothetical protein BASA50_010057 [Batrachochytrium salamandrivorans]KAH9270997.1 hypothetical protein BASA83_006749 [Batrachochytrium salamandrivorans]